MRTTITLDDDIVQKIKERIRSSGKTMKQIYNELLRSALHQPKAVSHKNQFKLRVFDGKAGLCKGFSWDLSTAETLNHLDELEFKKS